MSVISLNILCYSSIKRTLLSRVHRSKHSFLVVVYLHSYSNNLKTTSGIEPSTTVTTLPVPSYVSAMDWSLDQPTASIRVRTAAQPICLPTYQPTSHCYSQDVSLADKVSIKKRRKKKEYGRSNIYCSRSVSMATLFLKKNMILLLKIQES
jgi:hypothetical protein